MSPARIEFFTDDVDGVEYLNVGMQFERDGETVHAVLGAFHGEPNTEALTIIRALVEEASIYLLGEENDAGGGAGLEG